MNISQLPNQNVKDLFYIVVIQKTSVGLTNLQANKNKLIFNFILLDFYKKAQIYHTNQLYTDMVLNLTRINSLHQSRTVLWPKFVLNPPLSNLQDVGYIYLGKAGVMSGRLLKTTPKKIYFIIVLTISVSLILLKLISEKIKKEQKIIFALFIKFRATIKLILLYLYLKSKKLIKFLKEFLKKYWRLFLLGFISLLWFLKFQALFFSLIQPKIKPLDENVKKERFVQKMNERRKAAIKKVPAKSLTKSEKLELHKISKKYQEFKKKMQAEKKKSEIQVYEVSDYELKNF